MEGKTIFMSGFFLRCFREPIRVPRIKENRVPRIREIGSLQVHIGYLTFFLKKLFMYYLFPNIYTYMSEYYFQTSLYAH